MLFIQVVLPVILVFIIGYVVQVWKRASISSISILTIYILVPILVFRTFYETEFSKEHSILILYGLLFMFIIIWIGKVFSKLAKLDTHTESGLILSTAFMNAGNYGVPIVLY